MYQSIFEVIFTAKLFLKMSKESPTTTTTDRNKPLKSIKKVYQSDGNKPNCRGLLTCTTVCTNTADTGSLMDRPF